MKLLYPSLYRLDNIAESNKMTMRHKNKSITSDEDNRTLVRIIKIMNRQTLDILMMTCQ